LFWWPILGARVRLQPAVAALYLFAATLPCDLLSAFLVFCDRVVYQHYAAEPHHTGM
jgi:cytochrome c oxidase assembly factor CtaG